MKKIASAVSAIFAAGNLVSAAPLTLELRQIKTDFAGKFCYTHARSSIMPDGKFIITTQPLRLSGMDIFYGIENLFSSDHGQTWSVPRKSATLTRQKIDAEHEMTICDATPFFHKKSGKLLLLGHSVTYRNDQHSSAPIPRYTLWSVFDPKKNDWEPFRKLIMPDTPEYFSCGNGSGQSIETADGDLLIPVYCKSASAQRYSAMVMKCRFDGTNLKFLEAGSRMTKNIDRGLYEPSISEFNGKYYLCMRNDRAGYVASSTDGLHYSEPVKLCFDDGKESGNYNTQQHWLKCGGKLYMVYTRKGANNDHVFRHRAPLFIAEFDPEKMCLIRSTEMIAVPERGARLGNFGCTQISENEALIVASEWMQTTAPNPGDYRRCMQYGSDNSIFVVKVTPGGQK